ncbi:response regulator [Candidatus Uhrbacteria bacterium]|nr:response regulator [Candidatus Uhrbacteria bacterium]
MSQHSLLLLIEDDSFILQIYKTKLAKESFQVLVAKDGKEAMTILKDQTPSLVLLDLIMPNMDGFEVLQRMKQDDRLKHIPVIVLSNLSQESDKKRVMDLGAKAFLVKSDTTLASIVDLINEFTKPT